MVLWSPCRCSAGGLSAVGAAESLTELAGGSRELRGEDCLLLRRERREERESTQLILCHKHSTDLLPYREFFTKRIF